MCGGVRQNDDATCIPDQVRHILYPCHMSHHPSHALFHIERDTDQQRTSILTKSSLSTSPPLLCFAPGRGECEPFSPGKELIQSLPSGETEHPTKLPQLGTSPQLYFPIICSNFKRICYTLMVLFVKEKCTKIDSVNKDW